MGTSQSPMNGRKVITWGGGYLWVGEFRDAYGHTPLSTEEEIPWKCRRLVIGTGAYGKLPVTEELKREAQRRKTELVILSTVDAIELLKENPEATNAILHVTC